MAGSFRVATPNASQLYKGGDEDAPTNILQVGCCSCGTAHTRLW